MPRGRRARTPRGPKSSCPTPVTPTLAADTEGRFFVRNAAQELVVEVYKPIGRTVALGVEPGAYEVRVERERTALLAKVNVADGGQQMIDRSQLNPTKVEPTNQIRVSALSAGQ